jgi:MoxR-like ATPase
MSELRFDCEPGDCEELPRLGALPDRVHVFDQDSIDAVRTALLARRPLLVRGEPGTGKSQLAAAVARKLGWAFVEKVVDAHTESQDLKWSFDAVARLATAQVLGARPDPAEVDVASELAEAKFLRPGPLWWAYDWNSAKALSSEAPRQYPGCSPELGCVLLLDEIDKADSDVPNGLLEALGNGHFVPQGRSEPVAMSAERRLLVVVTTNEERSLPDAFLRRCVVLHLECRREDLPSRARRHFPVKEHPAAVDEVLHRASELLWSQREHCRGRGLAPPGQAEYLDLLRAVTGLTKKPKNALELLERLARFTFAKHPPERDE